jgi:hypothetical protein
LRNEAIIQRLQEADFAERTCNQVEREFLKVGLALKVVPPFSDLDHITRLIELELEVLLEQHPQLLAQLFYSMDLPEQQVNEIMMHAPDVAYSLSEKIIRRCAQKVYLRQKFASG